MTVASPPHEENQYLDLIGTILATGEHRPDRTGTGTLSLFAPPPLRFSLSVPAINADGTPDPTSDPKPILPLLTTKRVFLRGILAELLWFLSGSTSTAPLAAAGVHIWDAHGSRAHLDASGLTDRAEGDLGPVYGFQWRHFGAAYEGAEADYRGKGVDQVAEVVHKLRETPWDRRIVLSAWNPADMAAMALPPCHMFAQFYVSFRGVGNGDDKGSPEKQQSRSRGTLHCQLYQRSCDIGLGVPFNIASYALLTHMFAHAAGLIPGTLTHVMGDAHVYRNHVDALQTQLTREPRPFPELVIKRNDRGSGVMDGWTAEEVEVVGYRPHGAIKMNMSV